jgi:hypothetical protein
VLELHDKQLEDQETVKAARKAAETAIKAAELLEKDKLNLES